MANRYWRGITSDDWGNTANWSNTSGGSTGFSIPTSADDVFFDANGNNPCTLTSVSNFCLSFVMSNGYTSTFNHNTRTLNVTGAILTLSSAMTYTTTTGTFNFSQQGTITLNGNTVNNLNLSIFGGIGQVITFVGTNNIVNFTRSGGAASNIFTGGTVYISGNLTVAGQNLGTTLFRFVGGTGTWSGTGVLPTLEIVSGTLTLSGTVGCPRILTYLGGTVNTSGSTLSIQDDCTLNTSGINWVNASTNFVNATGTITFTSAFTLTGNLSLTNSNSVTVNFIGAGFFTTCQSITVGGVGIVWNLVNDITVTGDFLTQGGISSRTINNNTIFVGGNFTIGRTFTGTTTIVLNGTGIWSGSDALNCNLTFNTAGTITISGIVGFGTRTMTYTSGTIITTGSTLRIFSSCTLNTSVINWNNLLFNTAGTNNITLTSTLNVLGNLTIGSVGNVNVVIIGAGFFTNIGQDLVLTGPNSTLTPANDMTVGNITVSAAGTLNTFTLLNQGNLTASAALSGTGTVTMVGTGTWSGGTVTCNLTFNTAGTITVSGTVAYGTQNSTAGNLTYTTGSVITSSSTLNIFGGTWNTSGMIWSNLFCNSNNTLINLVSDINCVNLQINNVTFTPSGGNNINISGDLNLSNQSTVGLQSSTTNYRMVGTGTISANHTTGRIAAPLIFNTLGTITLSGTIGYSNSTFTHTSGTVNSGTSTFILGQATNFVINSTGFALNNLNPSTFNVTFSGTNGCTINNFSAGVVTAGVTHTFQSLRTYNIATLEVAATFSSPATIRSSTPSSQAILTLTNASYNYALNVTDIDSSLGAAGFTSGGILTNATNWTTAAAALYYIGSTNYSGVNLWSVISGGSPISAITAPTSSDPVIFDANSGNCIMNVAGVAGSVNFTNYTNTITFSNNLSVSGNITLDSGMTFAGAARLIYAGATNSTLTSNAKEVGVVFEFTCGANHTITFADNWTFGENLILQSNQSATVMIYNGNNLLCKKSLLTNNSAGRVLYGTTKIQMIGSGDIGTVIANLNFGLDLEINTVGSYTIQNLTWGYFGGRTLKYTTGTVTHAIGTTLFLSINTNATNTLDLNGIDFRTITITGGSTNVYNLSSNLKCATLSNSGTPFTVNGNTIYVTSYSCTANAQTGTSLIYFNGWNGDGTFASGNFQLSATIDTPNTLTITDVTAQGGASITHIQGNIVHTGTLTLATYTLSFLPNIILNIIFLNTANATATIQSDITCRVFSLGNVNVTLAGVGYTLYILNEYRGITSNSTYTNTAKISFIGSGIIAMIFGAGTTLGEFEINTSGVVNLVGQLAFSGTFRHVKGTVISKGSQVILRTGATVLGASRMKLDNVFIVGNSTITMDEFFSGTPQIPTKVVSSNNLNYTINFTDGFEKLAKNVRVSRCTISRRGQLLLLSKGGFGVNNLGIRYYNQLPNGVSTDTQKFVNNNLAGMPPLRAVNMLVGDPAFT